LTRLPNLESDSMYQGPAGYINVIGAGDGDDPEFFPLCIGQALNLRARLEQHGDPNHRKRYPSLQYGVEVIQGQVHGTCNIDISR